MGINKNLRARKYNIFHSEMNSCMKIFRIIWLKFAPSTAKCQISTVDKRKTNKIGRIRLKRDI